ncbi:MAG: hypothetical protein ORN56_00370 [Chitinophagales bacterium]|jgi:hypothetical protein|nr:hypothetical protein [Chitinophagales bacterium]
MKNLTTILAISSLFLAISKDTLANTKSAGSFANPVNSISVDESNTKRISFTNTAPVLKDTSYINGKAVVTTYCLTSGKEQKLFSVHNLNNEQIAYVTKLGMYNGRHIYRTYFIGTQQSITGSLYESPYAWVDLISEKVKDGAISANAVASLAKELHLEVRNDVAFTMPAAEQERIASAYAAEVARKATVVATTATPVVAVSMKLENESLEKQIVQFNYNHAYASVTSDKTVVEPGHARVIELRSGDYITLLNKQGAIIERIEVKKGIQTINVSADGMHLQAMSIDDISQEAVAMGNR